MDGGRSSGSVSADIMKRATLFLSNLWALIMSLDRLLRPEPRKSESASGPNKARRFQTGVRTLIVLVASCGVVLWAARYLWESQHPALAAARGLQARSPSERVYAIRELVQTGIGDTGIAIPHLIAALLDPDAEVRVAACEALTPLTYNAVMASSSADTLRSAITALIGSLQDPRPAVRIAAAKALDSIISVKGSAGVIDLEGMFVALTEMLGDRDTEVRIAALDALGSTARKVSVEPPAALAAGLADESAGIRTAAIKALACFHRDLDRWIPSIFGVLEREAELRVRNASLQALSQLRPPTYSTRALPALITGLSSRYPEIQLVAAFLVGALGPDARPAIPDLIKALSYPIDSTKVGPGKEHPMAWDPGCEAAQALSKIAPGTPSAGEVIQALTEVVRAGHPYRRVAAANALDQFGPAAVAAAPALIIVLRENAATKAAFGDGASAATALGQIAPGTPVADEAVASLIDALQAESAYTREQAINALLRFGPKATVSIPRLRALLNDPHASVSSAAAKALAALE
jgi:HEAT repeat protein